MGDALPENMRNPSLEIAGFRLWVHGSESDDLPRWLVVTARCELNRSYAEVHGAFMLAEDLTRFGCDCAAMHRGESDRAELTPVEPFLNVTLERSDALGHIWMRVTMSPELTRQRHWFEFEIDQSYLPGIVRQFNQIVYV